MPEVSPSRLPIPHLFMVLTTVLLALMTVSTFAAEAGYDPAGVTPESVIPSVDTLAIGSLLAFVALLAVVMSAGRAEVHGSGKPILGLAAGLLAGGAAAMSLYGYGAIPLGNPMWIWLPMVFSTLGTALGLASPFPRRSGAAPAIAARPVTIHPQPPYPVRTDRSA